MFKEIRVTDGARAIAAEVDMARALRLFNYIGYDLPDEGRLAGYLGGGHVNPDQLDVLAWLCGQPTGFRVPWKLPRNPEREARAARRFGCAADLKKAGFMLPDGRMLDFSQGARNRTLDHRSIQEVFGDDEEFGSAREYLDAFMREGNIRLHENGLDLVVPPTEAQRRALRRLRLPGDFFVMVTNQTGQEVAVRSHEGEAPSYGLAGRALADIDGYFADTFGEAFPA